MSILTPGRTGVLNGKTGDTVVARWRDKLVGKNAPRKSTKPPKLVQLVQRSKFGIVTSHMGNFSEAIAIGFQTDKGSLTPMNLAVRHAFENAITGVYPNFALDYSKIVLSKPGSKYTIDGTDSLTVVAEAGRKIKLSWTAPLSVGFSATETTDKLYAAFYDPTSGYFSIAGFKAGVRSTLSQTYVLSPLFIGHKVHGYVFFVSEDGRRTSISEFLPGVTVLA